MKTTDTNIFLTKPGLFVFIITSTIGIVVSLYTVFFASSNSNAHFMEVFGAVMAFNLFNAIRNTRRLLYTDRSSMSPSSKFNPFLSVNGIILTTICSTVCLCIFIPILANSITKGDRNLIVVSMVNVIIQAYVFYKAIHDVHKYLRKKEPEMYQRSY